MSETKRPTEKEIAALKEKHGEIYLLTAERGAVVVIPPPRHKYKRFKAAVLDKKKQESAMENLLADCVVWPEKSEYDALIDRYPGLTETWGDKLLAIAGVEEDATSEKL